MFLPPSLNQLKKSNLKAPKHCESLKTAMNESFQSRFRYFFLPSLFLMIGLTLGFTGCSSHEASRSNTQATYQTPSSTSVNTVLLNPLQLFPVGLYETQVKPLQQQGFVLCGSPQTVTLSPGEVTLALQKSSPSETAIEGVTQSEIRLKGCSSSQQAPWFFIENPHSVLKPGVIETVLQPKLATGTPGTDLPFFELESLQDKLTSFNFHDLKYTFSPKVFPIPSIPGPKPATPTGSFRGTFEVKVVSGQSASNASSLETTQLLDSGVFQFKPDYNLFWAGDLDGDQKLDFILNTNDNPQDFGNVVMKLYLSTQAKPGEAVGEAGKFSYYMNYD
ncbi:MAG: hypothetical protein K2X66_05030 [Cyanobacteria bacterium]|nr:hypothetical protein [Cyanobacteriota bacterium]